MSHPFLGTAALHFCKTISCIKPEMLKIYTALARHCGSLARGAPAISRPWCVATGAASCAARSAAMFAALVEPALLKRGSVGSSANSGRLNNAANRASVRSAQNPFPSSLPFPSRARSSSSEPPRRSMSRAARLARARSFNERRDGRAPWPGPGAAVALSALLSPPVQGGVSSHLLMPKHERHGL